MLPVFCYLLICYYLIQLISRQFSGQSFDNPVVSTHMNIYRCPDFGLEHCQEWLFSVTILQKLHVEQRGCSGGEKYAMVEV